MPIDPCASPAVPGTGEGTEEQVSRALDLFYVLVHEDPLIGPVFKNAIKDWDAHMQAMRDFWSTALLGAARYKNNAFAAHMRLPLDEPHFARWLALWEQAATEAMPPSLAERAIKRARHMTQSFKTGLLPYKRPDGTLSRTRY